MVGVREAGGVVAVGGEIVVSQGEEAVERSNVGDGAIWGDVGLEVGKGVAALNEEVVVVGKAVKALLEGVAQGAEGPVGFAVEGVGGGVGKGGAGGGGAGGVGEHV